jgi:hypothetical protein
MIIRPEHSPTRCEAIGPYDYVSIKRKCVELPIKASLKNGETHNNQVTRICFQNHIQLRPIGQLTSGYN